MSAFLFSRSPHRYQVPHDRVGIRLVMSVHCAVARAFEMIREDGYALGSASENHITERLENTLENRVLNRGEVECFNLDFFRSVGRGSEVVNFNGVKISKKPDLVFKLRREHRVDWDQCQDALFAECKPVDRQHSLTGHYCAVSKDCTGIERFIIGDYAWAMHEAFMIGYVRDGFQVTPHLADSLAAPKTRAGLGEPSSLTCIVKATKKHCPELHLTTHQRLFSWSDGRPATAIDLYHSWHECS